MVVFVLGRCVREREAALGRQTFGVQPQNFDLVVEGKGLPRSLGHVDGALVDRAGGGEVDELAAFDLCVGGVGGY